MAALWKPKGTDKMTFLHFTEVSRYSLKAESETNGPETTQSVELFKHATVKSTKDVRCVAKDDAGRLTAIIPVDATAHLETMNRTRLATMVKADCRDNTPAMTRAAYSPRLRHH